MLEQPGTPECSEMGEFHQSHYLNFPAGPTYIHHRGALPWSPTESPARCCPSLSPAETCPPRDRQTDSFRDHTSPQPVTPSVQKPVSKRAAVSPCVPNVHPSLSQLKSISTVSFPEHYKLRVHILVILKGKAISCKFWQVEDIGQNSNT